MSEKLVIARLGHRGDGIADTASGAVYVPYTLPGERVSVDPVPGHPDRRQLVDVEAPSPDRVTPISPYFGTCGGCSLQHWALPRQHEWKRQLVIDALAHAGITADVGATIDAHGDGRRRIVLHARRRTQDVLEVGFAAMRSHQIVAIDHCPILAPSMAGAIEAAWAVAEAIKSGKPLDIQITASDAGLDIDARGSGALSAQETTALAAAEAHKIARITRHGELVAQRAQPVLTMGSAKVALPPGAFLQATRAGEETLARLVLDYARKAKNVADLFCGVGPFALRLAGKARVTAADSDAAAVDALKNAAAKTAGLKPVSMQVRDLFRRPFVPAELKDFDTVVFDPPRQGAEAQARELAASHVRTVIAVSCDPETFARDARALIDGGYKLESVTPVDQFRYSAHVELVARFSR